MKIIAKNKKAFFDYEILEKFEAGMVLEGCEIKSIREGNVNLKGSYIILKNGEAWAKGMHISEYKFANQKIDTLRERKLLLKKREIDKIGKTLSEKGVTCSPIAVGISQKGFAKLEIAIARGKKKYDKRADLKQKDQNREIARKLKKF